MVEADKIPVPVQNRAFQYGDGLFETMIWQNGKIRYLADHYQRLTAGMAALSLTVPPGLSARYLQNSISQLAKTCQLGDNARVRLQVWRKAGGLYTPDSQGIDFLLTVLPLVTPTISVKANVIFYEEVRLYHSAISSFKTSSALPYVLAGLARKAAHADDAILLDVHGHVAECVASNLFWLKNRVLYTPSLESGCVAGVMRKNVITQMQNDPIPIKEGLFKKESLLSADAVFCCNVAGMQWIESIEKSTFETPVWLAAQLGRVLGN